MVPGSPYARLLAIHPSTRGFGWALFEGPLAIVDWGLAKATGDKNADSLQKIEALIAQYHPDAIVLEEFEHLLSRRQVRIKSLYRSIVALGYVRGVSVRVIPRTDIRRCFITTHATTRYQVAKAVATHLSALRPRLPPPRKPWLSEDPRMALFAAAALGIAHYAIADLSTDTS